MSQELYELAAGKAALTLSNIGNNGNCSALNLCGKAISFRWRELRSQPIYLDRKSLSLLPGEQIFVGVRQCVYLRVIVSTVNRET